MKKLFSLAMCVLMLFINGCDRTIYHWSFNNKESLITGMYIVEAETTYEYKVIKTIPFDKKEELIKDIENINYVKYGFNLWVTRGMCFVIKFSNEEYDIISYREPEHVFYDEDGLTSFITWLECDRSYFDSLINKYMED